MDKEIYLLNMTKNKDGSFIEVKNLLVPILAIKRQNKMYEIISKEQILEYTCSENPITKDEYNKYNEIISSLTGDDKLMYYSEIVRINNLSKDEYFGVGDMIFKKIYKNRRK